MTGPSGLVPAIDVGAYALLVTIAIEDLRSFRIRNSLVGAVLALFGLRTSLTGSEDLLWHAAFAAAVLAVMFAAFVLSGVGAGDAKLMTLAGLWIGPERSIVFALILAVATVLSYVAVRLHWLPARGRSTRLKFPFGPSIVAAWIATALLLPLT